MHHIKVCKTLVYWYCLSTGRQRFQTHSCYSWEERVSRRRERCKQTEVCKKRRHKLKRKKQLLETTNVCACCKRIVRLSQDRKVDIQRDGSLIGKMSIKFQKYRQIFTLFKKKKKIVLVTKIYSMYEQAFLDTLNLESYISSVICQI